MSRIRDDLLQVYRAALAAVEGRACCRRFLERHPPPGPVSLLAIGKAAASMAQGAAEALDGGIVAGLVITKAGHGEPLHGPAAGLACLEAGHPLPDARSLAAGHALLDFIDAQPADATLLVLLSGGASALVEVLPAGTGLETLQRVNAWLLASGLEIGAMNAVRRGLSCIKGGRLARRLGGRRVLCLMISDVPGDDPAVIGSGLLAPAPATPLPAGLPAWLLPLLERAPPPPAPGDPCLDRVERHLVARLDQALQAAAEAGRALGYPVSVAGDRLAGDAAACGEGLARALVAAPPGLYVRGGETTVRLPPAPGRGGRNQHAALAAARVLRGRSDCALLMAGTDGSDGPGEDAGALVDGGTVARGEAAGLRAEDCLRRADSGRFLAASGDLLRTGPTGTNVMDLALGIRSLPDEA